MNYEYLYSLNLNSQLNSKVIDLINNDEVNVLCLAEKCMNDNFDGLKRVDDLTILAVIVCCLESMHEKYKELNIDDKVFFDTISDIKIWCENNGNKGLKNVGWIKNHLRCELFRLGRLQFQIYKCENKTLNYDLLPFNYGENLIYIHIPQGERLVYADCINSIKEAIAFFDEHFSNYNFKYFFCESWLLYCDNWLFMESSSNILQFSTLFDVVYSVDDDRQAIERIFGKRRIIKSAYPQQTSLQKNVVNFMKNGGRLGVGIGIINKNDI